MSVSRGGLWSGKAAWGWAALLLAAVAMPAVAANAVETVETQGFGTLTMCRSWLFFSSCQSYNRVEVPKRVTLGDRIGLVFGSNTKQINFPVARIAQAGNRCTIYNDSDSGTEKVDKIEVDSCRPVSP